VESTRGHNLRGLAKVLAGLAVGIVAIVVWSGTSSAAPSSPPPGTTRELLTFVDGLTTPVEQLVDPLVIPLGLPPVELSVAPTLDPLVGQAVVPVLDDVDRVVNGLVTPLLPPGTLPEVPALPTVPAAPGSPNPAQGALGTTEAPAAPTSVAIGSTSTRLLQLAGIANTLGGADAGSSDATDRSTSRVPFAPTVPNVPTGRTASSDNGAGAAGLLLIAFLAGAAAHFGPPAARHLRATGLLPRQLALAVPSSPD